MKKNNLTLREHICRTVIYYKWALFGELSFNGRRPVDLMPFTLKRGDDQ